MVADFKIDRAAQEVSDPHILSQDDSISWETRRAADSLIKAHQNGQPVKVSARGDRETVLKSLESQIFGFVKSHRIARNLAEALVETTTEKTEKVGAKAHNNYIGVTAIVADRFDSKTMFQFEETGYFEVTSISKEGAVTAGIPDVTIQLGISGTTMTSNKADVDAMFASAKQWALYIVPEIATVSDIQGAEAEAIAAIGEMAASGADLGTNIPPDASPEKIAEMIQSGEISPQTLSLVNATVELSKLETVAAHPSAPKSVQTHIDTALETISSTIEAGLADGTIPNGIAAAVVETMAEKGQQVSIDAIKMDAPSIAQMVERGADNLNAGSVSDVGLPNSAATDAPNVTDASSVEAVTIETPAMVQSDTVAPAAAQSDAVAPAAAQSDTVAPTAVQSDTAAPVTSSSPAQPADFPKTAVPTSATPASSTAPKPVAPATPNAPTQTAAAPKIAAPTSVAPAATNAPTQTAAAPNQPAAADSQVNTQIRPEPKPEPKPEPNPVAEPEREPIKFDKGCPTGCTCSKCKPVFKEAASGEKAPPAHVIKAGHSVNAQSSEPAQTREKIKFDTGCPAGCGCSKCKPAFKEAASRKSPVSQAVATTKTTWTSSPRVAA